MEACFLPEKVVDKAEDGDSGGRGMDASLKAL